MSGRCIVVGAGEWTEPGLVRAADDLVIAADGGWRPLLRCGIRPDLVIGDFDSSDRPADLPVLSFPVRKDQTDMQLALAEGFARGYRRFAIYGGTGGRADHTLANLQCLLHLSRQGARAVLYGRDIAYCSLTGGTLRFPAGMRGTLSVFAQGGDAVGVTETGLSYSLQEATLCPDDPLGVSNAFVGQPSTVTVRQGSLLLCWQRPNPEPEEE